MFALISHFLKKQNNNKIIANIEMKIELHDVHITFTIHIINHIYITFTNVRSANIRISAL